MSNIVVDFDDCGMTTLSVMHGMHKELMPDYELPQNCFLTPDNAPALPQILQEGLYLERTPLKKGFEEVLRRLKGLGHKIYACTHRGFHPDAKMRTDKVLAPIADIFEEVFYLDPKTHRNKVGFLSQKFQNKFYLIDDNPGFGTEVSLTNVILFEQPWNKSVKGAVHIKDWNFLEVFGALALVQARRLRVPFDGNFEHE